MKTVQQTVEEKYTNSDGNLHAYPLDQNSQYLSESIGLYMQYLVLVEDEKNFEIQVDRLVSDYLVEQNELVFVRWVLYEDATVNALIDDVRIIASLNEASELFNQPAYEKLSSRLEETISRVQQSDGIHVDFYDWTFRMPAERITLSYLINDYSATNKTKQLLISLDDTAVFFPEYYDVKYQKYIESKEVHLIDQLLIAINRQDMGHGSSTFENWVTREWKSNGKLLGRYDRQTQEATVNYESLAVYYYLSLYFNKINEPAFAKEVMEQAEKIATAKTLADTHFFDYIQYQMLLEKNTKK
ncbi:hypothetical protein [Sporosarcina sp. G11-34]|uniref:hypothetical protein n=1 Tax=Sporosarcina sp. G11-34 TaxID=2849605 RepID=UPI0022A96FD4|nr:hypothetical protein [Sporosarcina sp. G11-34]MCZ2256963.1 hypothetical protein [Sporosarcina sp. G11-34]